MKENFIPYHMALRLKQKGCPMPKSIVYAVYDDDRSVKPMKVSLDNHTSKPIAPTIKHVLTWLRCEKKLIVVCPYYNDGYYYTIQRLGCPERFTSSFVEEDKTFSTYEEAALAGIRYILDHLI